MVSVGLDRASPTEIVTRVALMRSSDDWDDFHKRLDRALPVFKPMPLLEWAERQNLPADE
jgi:hypothetical protein